MDTVRPISYTPHMATAAERPLRKDAERNRRRILDAAAELFMQRGLDVTLNDIARHADVGVGTVYRRFPSKELLIDALFVDRFTEMAERAEAALGDPDPWHGLTSFLRESVEVMVRDRGLKQLLLGTPQGCGRVGDARARIMPVVHELIGRAHAGGRLREDVTTEDLAVIQWMLSAVIDYTGDIRPELWRRYADLVFRALENQPAPARPLPVPPLAPEELRTLLEAGAERDCGRVEPAPPAAG
jgi:AcrR family transcriptional regulator